MRYDIAACGVLALFYGAYFGKMFAQRRRGIRTDAIARDKTDPARYRTELVMKAATILVSAVQLVSIACGASLLGNVWRTAGFVTGLAGDAFFAAAAYTMRDSWRAGVAASEHRPFVSEGVFRISRNPAFLGFDLMYLGVLLMYGNVWLLLATVFAVTMLHLQILQEEKYLAREFGDRYEAYRREVCRYLGRKRSG
ncbi:MAG: isoprenylcysteine carboxylmethyltransferase family protein [Clostridia bacterium]|nr:isoprenylcysteine carboxylmethyltransferase family protein [Clostridia bacterium]